jgi:hypothetical protein
MTIANDRLALAVSLFVVPDDFDEPLPRTSFKNLREDETALGYPYLSLVHQRG